MNSNTMSNVVVEFTHITGPNGSLCFIETAKSTVEINTVKNSVIVDGELIIIDGKTVCGLPDDMSMDEWANWAYNINDVNLPHADPTLYGWDSTAAVIEYCGADPADWTGPFPEDKGAAIV